MYQPKTGQRCSCKRGIQRDNCPSCEGTGWVIDFAAIRSHNHKVALQSKDATYILSVNVEKL